MQICVFVVLAGRGFNYRVALKGGNLRSLRSLRPESEGPLFADMLLAESSKKTGDTHTREQPSEDDVFAESPKRTGDTHSKQEEKQSMLFAESSKRTGGTHTPVAAGGRMDMRI